MPKLRFYTREERDTNKPLAQFSDYIYTEEIKIENINGRITSGLCHTPSIQSIFIFPLAFPCVTEMLEA